MKWAVLSTWKMSFEGNCIGADVLADHGKAGDAVVSCIQNVEDNPNFVSVGLGGLPDETGHVLLDGAFMDGDTLRFGAVGSIEGFRSPIAIARSLKDGAFNNVLVGHGAEVYARAQGFDERNNLTEASYQRYLKEQNTSQNLFSYDGHDTVCTLARDEFGSLCAGVSTSGLFLKKQGRIGDSPVIGSGFYADSQIGAAAATGVGEEIMKGVLSYTAVMYLSLGKSAQEAAETAVYELDRKLKLRNGRSNSMSLIVLDKDGNYGVGTNVSFPFVYASDSCPSSLFLARADEDGHTVIEQVKDHSAVTQD